MPVRILRSNPLHSDFSVLIDLAERDNFLEKRKMKGPLWWVRAGCQAARAKNSAMSKTKGVYLCGPFSFPNQEIAGGEASRDGSPDS
jgi:hypothetical protein